MRVLMATDAWHPQINGVVRTIAEVEKRAASMDVEIHLLTTDDFRTVPLPGYPEIPMAIPNMRTIARRIAEVQPEAIHVSTEAPVGFFTRRHCIAHDLPFTTSFHTRLPDYVSVRLPAHGQWASQFTWSWLRRFHKESRGVFAATPALVGELQTRGFRNVMLWPRGVDTALFRPRPGADLGVKRPVFLSVGRVAVEKNLDAFLSLDLPGTKVVAGDGPARAALQAKYPDAVFLGALTGEALARTFAAADVFVFPSRTDTFGLVILEALASGLPVAAYPVTGPIDVIGSAPVGVLADDLRSAAMLALHVPRENCRAFAERQSWDECTRRFIANIVDSGSLIAAGRTTDVTLGVRRSSVAA